MNKPVKKFLFGDLYNIEEYEEFFSEMSRGGLHLQKIGGFFAYFREDKPRHLNYRIDIVKKDDKGIKDERIKKHKNKGWNFVCEKDIFLIFSSPEGSDLKELYETPEAQKLIIKESREKKLGKKFTNTIIPMALVLCIIIIFYVKLNVKNNFYLSLNNGKSLISMIFLLMSTFKPRRQSKKLQRLERVLDSNEFLKHQGDYLLMKGKFILRKSIFILFIMVLTISVFYRDSRAERIKLDEIMDLHILPVVTIEEIEKIDYSSDKGLALKRNETEYGNTLYRDWSLFIPKEYTLIESVVIYDQNKDKSEDRSYLILDYYLTRFDSIAKGLENDILYRETEKHSLELNKIKNKQDLSLYGIEINEEIILLCRKGRQVVFLRYDNGRVSLEKLGDMVVNKLENNE